MMELNNQIKLAQWYGRRGVRMLKCARGVESCSHAEHFSILADKYFFARDQTMEQAREQAGSPIKWKFVIEEEDGSLYEAEGFDELSAGARYEEICELHGFTVGNYRVLKQRDRL